MLHTMELPCYAVALDDGDWFRYLLWDESASCFTICSEFGLLVLSHLVLFAGCTWLLIASNFNLLRCISATDADAHDSADNLYFWRCCFSVLTALACVVDLIVQGITAASSNGHVQSHVLVMTIAHLSVALVAWIMCSITFYHMRQYVFVPRCLLVNLGTGLALLAFLVRLFDCVQRAQFYEAWFPVTCTLVFLLLCQISVLVCNSLTVHVREYLDRSEEREDTASLLSSDRSQASPSPYVHLGAGDENASLASCFTFWWANALMKKGRLGQLNSLSDLYSLPVWLMSDTVGKVYQKAAQQETIRQMETGSTFTLMRVLFRCFGWPFLSLGVLRLVADLSTLAGPLLLNYLISFMETPGEPMRNGYLYATGLFGCTLVCAICSVHFSYQINRVALKTRSALVTAVYDKSIRISVADFTNHFSMGEVMTLMSTDVDRVVNYYQSFHAVWSLPVQMGVALYLLHQQVGLAFLAGLGFAIFLVPINRWIAVKIGQLSSRMMQLKDARVKLMTELLLGIRVVKFGAWERFFEARVAERRDAEVDSLKGRKYLDALCVYFWAAAPVVISILTFSTYALMGNELTAAKVFTSMALFNILMTPLNAFPWVINGLVEAWVSAERLQRFLSMPEINFESYYRCSFEESGEDLNNIQPLVRLSYATFCWGPHEGGRAEPLACLKNFTLQMERGQLVGLVGAVGSGKSSVFAAVLAELHKCGGDVHWSGLGGSAALCTQDAWLQHGTVRDNILFGRPYNAEFYDAVVDACALRNDLRLMPGGDLSEVGDQGVTLSGGQRARIALARAVYQDAELYLLDDPLSAVDAHVAAHIFQHCICGLLLGKTVLLATHHTRFLQHCSSVVILDRGRMIAAGPPAEVLPTYEQQGKSDKSAISVHGEKTAPPTVDDIGPSDLGGTEVVLVQSEEKQVGSVQGRVYASYFRAVGWCLLVMIFISLALMQAQHMRLASKNLSDWWLSYWVMHDEQQNNTLSNVTHLPQHLLMLSENMQPYAWYVALRLDAATSTSNAQTVYFYLKVYGGLAGANTVFTFARAFLFAYGGVCAAKRLHNQLLRRLLAGSVRFFDVTPLGRIVNRFSSDLYCVDDSLPFQSNRLVAKLFDATGTFVMICYGLPWFTACLVPIFTLYYYMQNYYRYTTCELKRLCSVSLSPLYIHFTDTLTGMITIRAFRASTRFRLRNRQYLDQNQAAQFSALACSQWLAVRLQLLGIFSVTAVAFVAVLQHHFGAANAGLVGLAISYALAITGILNDGISAFTETEKELVSVERIQYYIDTIPVEQESDDSDSVIVGSEWPTQGAVEFVHVYLRYDAGLPFALHDAAFSVRPMEKLGIVGRTGSGKSSLFQALFRTVPLASGQIFIDGVSIADVRLQVLRSKLAIIPQNPFLFSGTVRENLDIGYLHSDADDQYWKAIQAAGIQSLVTRLGGLDGMIGERGAGLSCGERQLICLTRALMSKAVVVCIDEATAQVDRATDELIQQTIRTCFANATVLTIAHRIHTVMHCDRILVMDNGRVAEFGTPTELMQDGSSLFAAFVKSGL